MDNKNLLSRVLAAGLPLLVIALIAGAAGYVTKKTETAPIPPLAATDVGPSGVRGPIQRVSGDQVSILTAAGESVTLRLKPDLTVEVLQPISVAQLIKGDWINGGAIPHADSVLALVGLVVIADPVLQTP